jgi:pimeloyl-ACP methyl ester carboxylesterase
MRPRILALLTLTAACGPRLEPLDLPADPAARGAVVGVKTYELEDLTLEVWYPAAEEVAGLAGEPVDANGFVPDTVVELLGAVDLPTIDSYAVRDAPLRDTGEPLPVVLFSHGFGGFRTQSIDYTQHLASRGYVVVAPDHPGRMMGDILPCMFDSLVQDCSIDLDDPGEDDLPDALDVVEGWNREAEGFFEGRLDLDGVGLAGHSAGGMSTATVGDEDPRFTALMPMTTNGSLTREVPVLYAVGSCDATVPAAESLEAYAPIPDGRWLSLVGAGHLSPTNLCDLDLGGFAETLLAPRDDVNAVWLEQLVGLATDGCPQDPPQLEHADCAETYWPLEESQAALRHYATVFFDEQLRGEGSLAEAGLSGAVLE